MVEDLVHGEAGGGSKDERDLVEDGAVKGWRPQDEGEVPEGEFVAVGVGPGIAEDDG